MPPHAETSGSVPGCLGSWIRISRVRDKDLRERGLDGGADIRGRAQARQRGQRDHQAERVRRALGYDLREHEEGPAR